MQISGTLRPTPIPRDIGKAVTASDKGKGRKSEPGSTYIDRLTRLFPVEGVTLYPLAIGVAAGDRLILIIAIVFIALFMGFLRYFATQPTGGGKPRLAAVAVSIGAFLLYAFTLGAFGYVFGDVERHTLLSSIITIVVTGSLGALRFEPSPDDG